jgi:DNA mismatch repair ATPase MutS|tara:strand:+ start:658 stop:975 length:318 start_codon:yes stop_codon:yes gene_type:complete
MRVKFGEINMWKNTIKKNKSEIDARLTELKEAVEQVVSWKPEEVIEDGKFIRSEVDKALDTFKDFEETLRYLREQVAEHGESLGLWDGSYGYDYLPSAKFVEEEQ